MSNHHSFVSKLLCAVLSVVMMISLIPAAAITANAAEKKDEGWLWPVPDSTYITPGRHFRDGHKGIDISASKTRIVVAAKSGTVKKVYSGCNNHSGFGRHSALLPNVKIRRTDWIKKVIRYTTAIATTD